MGGRRPELVGEGPQRRLGPGDESDGRTRAANARATASPIPREAPVTSTRFPLEVHRRSVGFTPWLRSVRRSPRTCGRCASRSARRSAEGDELVVLESMKMEIPVAGAASRGTVTEVRVAPDTQVHEGDVIAVIDVIRAAAAPTASTVLTIERPERRNAVDLATSRARRPARRAAAADGRVVVAHRRRRALLRRRRPRRRRGRRCSSPPSAAPSTALRHPAVVTHRRRRRRRPRGRHAVRGVVRPPRGATRPPRFGVPAAKLGLAVDHETVRRLAAFAGEGTARAMLLAAEELSRRGRAPHRLRAAPRRPRRRR